MTDGPVGVVRQRVYGLDRHHRTFEGRHTVEGQRYHQETQDRVVTQFVPCTGQRHHTVDHTAPARSQQNQGHYHTGSLCPVRQSGVVQVVTTGPNVDGDQCPEVHDGQTVRVNRTASLLRNEVVHDAQEACSQEETYCVMAPPPLNHGVDSAGVYRVRLGQ